MYKKLEKILVEKGIIIRPIPQKATIMMDAKYKEQHPNGEIRYSEEDGKDMLYLTIYPPNAGKFTYEFAEHLKDTVKFEKKEYFDSFDELATYLINRYSPAVETNIGEVPIEEYRDIVAMQHGFSDYQDMRKNGVTIGNGFDPEN